MTSYLFILTIYAAGLAALGLILSRRVRSSLDFFVAGRRLPAGLLFSTLLAANIGGGSTVGAAGLGYSLGLSAWWWVGSAGIGQLLLAFTVGPRLWRLAGKQGFYTLGDFLHYRYDRRVRFFTAVLLWVGSLAILAAQLIGIAWILNIVTGASKPVGCLIGGLCVTLYFASGGLFSASWVNLVQLVVKGLGFGLALPLALAAVGGWDGIVESRSVRELETSFLQFTGIGASQVLGFLVLLVPPFIVSPGLVQKIYGARNEKAVCLGTAANGIVLLLFSFVPVLMGMAASAAFPGMANPEMALPMVMTGLVPLWVGALALAAVFSAEVSSADAVLFMLSTSLSKDFYKAHLRPQATEEQLFGVSRLTSVLSGGLGVALAVLLPSIISALSIFYGLVTVSLFVPVVAGLYFEKPGVFQALCSIGLAVPATVLIHVMTPQGGLWGVSSVTCGLVISLVAFVGSGLIVRSRSKVASAGAREM